VEYAHRRFLAHCDLKFSNILVPSDGRPRLLDFGITKVLEPLRFGFQEQATQAAGRPFTPAFASPEQVKGERLTTATDLYSAGVVLYALLTGTHPFQAVLDQPVALLHATVSSEAEPPSHRWKDWARTDPAAAQCAAEARAATPPRLWQELHGDVDSIVLQALGKKPEQRYTSAALFAADLRNFLAGRPVEARHGSTRYRTWKFVRRNPAAILAAASLISALLAGAAGVFWQGVRAQRSRTVAEARFHDASRLTSALLVEFFGAVQRLDRSDRAQQLLVQWSRETLDDLARQSETDLSLQADLAETYLRVGTIQSAGDRSNPARLLESIASLDRGLVIANRVLKNDPGNYQILLTKARLLEARSRVEGTMGRLQESARDSQAAAELVRSRTPH